MIGWISIALGHEHLGVFLNYPVNAPGSFVARAASKVDRDPVDIIPIGVLTL